MGNQQKVAIIGSDGRAAAIAWKLLQEDCQVHMLPGNPGMNMWPGVKLWTIDPTDYELMARTARHEKFDLTVVSSEVPLAAGIVDLFESHDCPIVGPTKDAAQIETSKGFCAQLLNQADVPAPDYAVFEKNALHAALQYLVHRDPPYVIKYDGLMAGKGVVVTNDTAKAQAAIRKFIGLGQIVIQEFLEGQECSFQVLTDGLHAVPLRVARDYKRASDGDQGENTGGMGSYAPFSLAPALEQKIMADIVYPTITAMQRRRLRYRGIMYFGLMLTRQGPKVLEINCRLGDPEAESILLPLKSSLYDLLLATTKECCLKNHNVQWSNECAVTVTLAAAGYPGTPRKGDIISGIEHAQAIHGVHIFPAGVAKNHMDQLVTDGGRVLYVTAARQDAASVRAAVYAAVNEIRFDGMQYRTDIAAETVTLTGT